MFFVFLELKIQENLIKKKNHNLSHNSINNNKKNIHLNLLVYDGKLVTVFTDHRLGLIQRFNVILYESTIYNDRGSWISNAKVRSVKDYVTAVKQENDIKQKVFLKRTMVLIWRDKTALVNQPRSREQVLKINFCAFLKFVNKTCLKMSIRTHFETFNPFSELFFIPYLLHLSWGLVRVLCSFGVRNLPFSRSNVKVKHYLSVMFNRLLLLFNLLAVVNVIIYSFLSNKPLLINKLHMCFDFDEQNNALPILCTKCVFIVYINLEKEFRC